jgi:hypothetical protein
LLFARNSWVDSRSGKPEQPARIGPSFFYRDNAMPPNGVEALAPPE